MDKTYPHFTVTKTSPAARETISRILIDEKRFGTHKCIAEVAKRISENLGFKEDEMPKKPRKKGYC